MKIRHYGILSNRNKKDKLLLCKQLLGVDVKESEDNDQRESWEDLLFRITGVDPRVCPYCGKGRMVRKEALQPKRSRCPPWLCGIKKWYSLKSPDWGNDEVCFFMEKWALNASFFRGECSTMMLKRYSIIKIFNWDPQKAKEKLDSIPIAGDLKRLSPTWLYVEWSHFLSTS